MHLKAIITWVSLWSDILSLLPIHRPILQQVWNSVIIYVFVLYFVFCWFWEATIFIEIYIDTWTQTCVSYLHYCLIANLNAALGLGYKCLKRKKWHLSVRRAFITMFKRWYYVWMVVCKEITWPALEDTDGQGI